MSKITPKNLSYDATLPPFLARLQQNSNPGGRNEIQHARPKKVRTTEDEAEDEPVFFDEASGETLTKREWEEKETMKENVIAESNHKPGAYQHDKSAGETKEGAEKVAAIGGNRKRKVGKVIAEDDEEEDAATKRTQDIKPVKLEGERKKGAASTVKGKVAKKGKKIKLSFGDDD